MQPFKFIVTAFLTVLATATLAQDFLPENHSVNGGITIIPIDSKQKPTVSYDGRRIVILPSNTPKQWLLVVGIPLDRTASIQDLIMSKPLQGKIPFHVTDKHYKTQSLKIEDIRKVTPSPEDEKQIALENKEMANIFAKFTAQDPFSEQFKAPIRGPVTSLFGLQRIYNGIPQNPHSGLDIAAPMGAPIKAVAKGTVVATASYFYTGNTVIIDHGMGVFSLYAHMSSFSVQKGQQVKQGQVLGKVGQTGRATGPHLHWTMVMNGALVEPLLFVPYAQINVWPTPKPKQETKA